MMPRSNAPSGRFLSLDAWRGICALLVALFHLPVYHVFKDRPGFANLQLCVDFFFVLSGFVLSHSASWHLKDRTDAMRFMAQRLARLWPLHACILAAFVLLEIAKYAYSIRDPGFALDAPPFGSGRTGWELASNLILVQSFHLHPGLSWNGPAWSVATEFAVSALFALVLVAVPRRREAAWLGLVAMSGLLLWRVSPATLFVSFDWGFLRSMVGFFAGCLVHALRQRSPDRLTHAAGLELGSLAVAVTFMAATSQGASQYAMPLVAGALIYVYSYDQGPVSAFLKRPALQKLGLWSYSIYMVHSLLFQVMKTAATFGGHRSGLELTAWHHGEKLVLLGTPAGAVVPSVLVLLVVVVPVSAMTYRLIEKPAMDWARRRMASSDTGGRDARQVHGVSTVA